MNRQYFLRVGAALAVCIPSAPSAQAQDASAARPYRGLFGQERALRPNQPTMTLGVSAFGASEVDAGRARSRPARPSNAVDPGVQGQLDFTRSRESFSMAMTTSARAQRYSPLDGRLLADGDVAVVLSRRTSRHTSLRIAQAASSTSRYRFGFTVRPFVTISSTPDEADPEAIIETTTLRNEIDGRVLGDRTLSLDTAVAFTRDLGRRSSLSVEYGHQQAQTFSGGLADTVADRAGAHFRRQWTPHLGARLGYGIVMARYPTTNVDVPLPQTHLHDIDVGVDYRRDIRLQQRTRLAFSTGTAVVSTPAEGARPVATGSASLTRDVGRTWHLQASYNRTVQYQQRLPGPMQVDAVLLTARGTAGRRFDALLTAVYDIGSVGVGQSSDRFTTARGTSSLQYAFTRHLALFAEWDVSAYAFSTAHQLPGWLPERLNHWTARTGITWRAPILR